MASGATRGIAIQRSIRSRNGPDTRRWYRSGSSGAHRQVRSDVPAKPHGQGFIAATSWNRAGKIVARPARAIATRPSSIG